MMRSTFKAMLLSTAAIAVKLEADQPETVVPEVVVPTTVVPTTVVPATVVPATVVPEVVVPEVVVPEVVVPVVPVGLTETQIIAEVLAKMEDAPCDTWMGMKSCYKKRVNIEGDDGDYFVESIENSKSTVQTYNYTWRPEWTVISPASTSFNLAPGEKETNIARYNTKGGRFSWRIYRLKISEV